MERTWSATPSVNPFAVTKPIDRVQENWSKAHIFFKLATTRDFWKLAKPWNVDYSHVKIAKHTIEYNGEKITMLAMGIPLKDKKHVIALYEFSKPVQGVKVRAFLIEVDKNIESQKATPTIKTVSMTTNGVYTATSSCTHECTSDSDCGLFSSCSEYCCKMNWWCVAGCCIWCLRACITGPLQCILCAAVECPVCVEGFHCCAEKGTTCIGSTPP